MSTNQSGGGFQNILNTAEGFLGGGQKTQQSQASNINNYIDTAQGYLGHVGQQEGPGIQGTIDKVQGYFGDTPQSAAIHGGAGYVAGKASGNQGFVNTAQGLLSGGQQGAHPTSQTGGINKAIDTAQGFMGHTGQGGSGVQGYIDKAQGYLGQTGQAGTTGTTGVQHDQGGVSQLDSINRGIDTVQGYMGHTGQGGTGFQGTIDKAQAMTGYTGQAGTQGVQQNVAQGSRVAQQTGGVQSHHGAHGLLDKAKGLFDAA